MKLGEAMYKAQSGGGEGGEGPPGGAAGGEHPRTRMSSMRNSPKSTTIRKKARRNRSRHSRGGA